VAGKKIKGLVIVESPAKAKKISGYLGKDYKVLASMGHVRDLPANASEVPAEFKKQPWGNLGVNVDANFEPLYIVPKEKKKVVKELKDALKDAEELILATDEDREGESIGWHLAKLLDPKVPVKRMVFSEITKEAIQAAINNPRQLDENQVSAQETRRVLDRLYGYTLSPLLWKKVARGLSAGRVQSVAVRLLVSRELERLAFHSGTYWDLKAELATEAGTAFEAQLSTVGGKKVASGKDFDENTGKLKEGADVLLLDEAAARELQERLGIAGDAQRGTGVDWFVNKVETRQQVRKPYPPFTTSTLQQEGNRKLGMTARQTMQVAQRLYEDGYITYMRTDSVNLSKEAIDAARGCVLDRYGDKYLSPEPRQFQTKSKGAQEAHEAIRPAGTEMKTGDELGLTGPALKLYSLIWKRTVATQMAEARLRFQTVTIAAADTEFRATGRHVEFPGFFRAYVEGSDDPEAALDDQESALPPLEEKQPLENKKLEALAHETKPPARFTEATLVRELEADGIGRPSTYATIIGTIQDRGYVRKVGNQLVPTFTAMAVTRLLEDYFPNLVDLQFTAKMEQTLDDIATGEADRLPYLKLFYSGDEGLDQMVKANEERIDPRKACTLELAGLTSRVRVGRYGPYLEQDNNGEQVTASIPDDVAPADITNEEAEKLIQLKRQGPKSLGMHPEEGLPIFVLVGPFGPYLQLGEVTEDGPKPKRVSIPKNIDPSTITLDQALSLLSLPRTVGQHPETGKVVKAGIGRFGPYVLHDKVYKSLGKEDDVLTIELPRAVELLAQARTRSAPTPLRELGKHPEDGEPVAIFEGRYGPYVKHGKTNATIPKDHAIENVTLEEALTWIQEKAAKAPVKRGAARKSPKKKAAKKKASPKKKSGSNNVKKKAPKKKKKPDDDQASE
jgi:DNA topoisomerase I